MVDDDGPTDARWTPDHGHPIRSPCEPKVSGELKILCNAINLSPFIFDSMFMSSVNS